MAEPAVRTRVRLCGHLMLEIDGRDTMAAVPSGQARSLLAYLLTRPDRCRRRARRADRGGVAKRSAEGSSGAPARDPHPASPRPGAGHARQGRPQLRLALPEPVEVDVAAATQAIEAARSDGASAAWGGALEHARAALELLRPGLLPGQEGDRAHDERREHEALELEALEWTARGGLALGGAELAGVQRAARELVSRSASANRPRLLMEALAATGNVAEALQVYDELRCLLRASFPWPRRGAAGAPPAAADRGTRPRARQHGRACRDRSGADPLPAQRRDQVWPTRWSATDLPRCCSSRAGCSRWRRSGRTRPTCASSSRLAASFRVILWDKRGTGLSDCVAVDQLPTLEERMDDIRAVLDAARRRAAGHSPACRRARCWPRCSEPPTPSARAR